MKNSEIRGLTTAEVIERIDTEENMLARMKMNHAVSPLDNPKKITEAKKNVARMKTELTKRLKEQKQEQDNK